MCFCFAFCLLLPDIQAIYPLLDFHNKTRFEVHSSCMKALKTKLLHKLETTPMDDARYEEFQEVEQETVRPTLIFDDAMSCLVANASFGLLNAIDSSLRSSKCCHISTWKDCVNCH